MKLVYCGYDLFADCLEALPALGGEVMAIYTFPSDGVCDFHDRVSAFALSHGIPCTVGPITADDLARFSTQGCRWLISAGYAYRIPIEEGSLRGVNLHPALLPVGRGAWPMPVTILRGLRRSGVTLHKLAPRFDEGDILAQADFAVSADETLPTLTAKLQAAALTLFERFMADPEQVWAGGVPQAAGEYWSQPTKADMTILPSHTAAEADRILRAFCGVGCFYGDLPVETAHITQQPTPHPLADAYLALD
ncbi:MAG: hypothetical protein IKD37_07430 [Clostridia bacterium]|nr:hypothetical protein [Clostridia bacterium]